MYYKKLLVSSFTVLSLLGASLAHAQTSTTTDPGTTPGAPNTGAGGDAMQNLLILGGSGAVALIGAAYLVRTRKTQPE